MGFGVGQLFSAKYFPPEAKAKIQELVANLMAAYRARMQKLDWMDDKTKEQALQKLDTCTIKVGYPDHTRAYSKLVMRKDDRIGTVRRAADADWEIYSWRFNGPVDKTDCGMAPQ